MLSGAAVDALQRLHGDEYHSAKIKILAPLGELGKAADQRIQNIIDARQAEYDQLARQYNQQTNLQLVLAVLVALFVAASLAAARRP